MRDKFNRLVSIGDIILHSDRLGLHMGLVISITTYTVKYKMALSSGFNGTIFGARNRNNIVIINDTAMVTLEQNNARNKFLDGNT